MSDESKIQERASSSNCACDIILVSACQNGRQGLLVTACTCSDSADKATRATVKTFQLGMSRARHSEGPFRQWLSVTDTSQTGRHTHLTTRDAEIT